MPGDGLKMTDKVKGEIKDNKEEKPKAAGVPVKMVKGEMVEHK